MNNGILLSVWKSKMLHSILNIHYFETKLSHWWMFYGGVYGKDGYAVNVEILCE